MSKRDTEWMEKFNELKEFQRKFSCFPTKNDGEYKRLYSFCHTIRVCKRTNKLTDERIALLDSIGFDWSPSNSKWETSYNQLKEFYATNNRWPSARSKDIAEQKLGSFVRRQRSLKKMNDTNILTPEKESALNAIGFCWDDNSETWDKNLLELKEFLAKQCRYPLHSVTEERSLADFCTSQRKARNKGKLSDYREKLLNSINFEWDPYEQRWLENFTKVKNFYIENQRWPRIKSPDKEEVKLAKFCDSQRQGKKKQGGRTLTEEHERMLDEIAFEWEPSVKRTSARIDKWNAMYLRLVEFYRKEQRWPRASRASQGGDGEEYQLAVFCTKQKCAFADNLLEEEHKRKLLDINLDLIGVNSKNRPMSNCTIQKFLFTSSTGMNYYECMCNDCSSKFIASCVDLAQNFQRCDKCSA